ncbi:MAG: YihY/virulence factor BrkB family protein [Thermoleophilia bacterium]|nr:YihY/virulence factor BrkB family protein [Thermoleophilia bacterium]
MGRLWKLILRARADGCTGLASMLAYNFFLAVMGVLILTVATLAYLPVENLGQTIVDQLRDVLPSDALSLIDRTLERTINRGRLPIFLISLFGTLYVMSNGYLGLITSLNRIYRLQERRHWLKVRLRALIMSMVAAGFILSAFTMVIVAPSVADALSGYRGIADTVSLAVDWMRWPVIILLAVAGVETTYRYGPAGGPIWRFLTPGTLLAAGAWLLSTLAFGFYVNRFGTYQNVYGTLGAVIVLLTWMWISAILVLIGAEVNMMMRGGARMRLEAPEQIKGKAPDV